MAAIRDASAASQSGIPDAEVLLAFTEALVRGTDPELSQARARLRDAVGVEGLVDAAAVVGMFERMDRIADSTGVPLDTAAVALSADLQDELDLRSFSSAGNTRATSRLVRAAGSLLRPVVRVAFRALGRFGRG